MQIIIKWIIGCLLIINLSMSTASTEPVMTWYSKNRANDVVLNVDLFASSTCPHCQKAESFFHELSNSIHWISVNRHVINEDKAALKVFFQQLQRFHSNNFSVPTVIFCDSRWLGFDSSDTTGKVLLKALKYCHDRIEKEGKLSESTVTVLQKWSATGAIDIQMAANSVDFSTIERVVVAAFAEAFSPCSLFCFFIFLSFIWMHPDRRAVQFVLGMGFILTLGAVHFIQMSFFEYYQLLQQYASWPSALSGASLLVYVYYFRKLHQIGASPISWKWSIPVVIASTAIVFVQQQTCELNIGSVFSQWLQTQQLTPAAYSLYQAAYLVFYLTSMVLLMGFYGVFGVHPRAILSSAGWVLLMMIGGLLLFYPVGLSSLGLSCCVIVIALGFGWWSRRRLNVI